ncbi:MAG: polysaccharide export protein EpsE [Spongiibacteraceae bacterium]
MRKLITLLLLLFSLPLTAAETPEYVLTPGDIIRITVYQNPDLTTETRVSESGTITFPLLGSVRIATLSVSQAEKIIATRLRDGNFVQQPQVIILPMQIRGSQVAVLGQVNRPGRYPLELANTRISDILATAGGISPLGADTIVLSGTRNGRPIRKNIDVNALFVDGTELDEPVSSGDTLFVERAQVFYIYGQVNRPGAFRLERNMSVMQALATGGGVTARGTERGLRVHRRSDNGKLQEFEPKLEDLLQANDVIYVRESIF